jgi:hypothetical protein
MKKSLILFLTMLSSWLSFAQPTVNTCFQPNAAGGQDAYIFNLDNGCVPRVTPPPFGGNTPGVVNFGNATELMYMDWTWNAWNCPGGTIRSLIRFNEIDALPTNIFLQSADLTLFGVPTSLQWGNNQFPGTSLNFDNSGWLRRALTPWNEQTVSWSGTFPQPAVSTIDQIGIPPSTSQWNWNTTINVLPHVQNILNGTNTNYGWMMQLQNENTYRSVIFASSDYPDAARRPRLCVTYQRCADFSYCFKTTPQPQLIYQLTAMYPSPAGTTYEWFVNNNWIGSGANITVDLGLFGPPNPTQASYNLCLKIRDQNNNIICEKCHDLCVYKPGTSNGNANNGSEFQVCRNTLTPNVISYQATTIPATGTFTWQGFTNSSSTPVTQSGPTVSNFMFTAYSGPGFYPNIAAIRLTYTDLSGVSVSSGAAICLYENLPRPANNDPANDGSVPQYDNIIKADDIVASNMKVSPNPTSAGWNVELLGKVPDEEVVLNVIDITGRLIHSQKSTLHNGSNLISIPGDNFRSGIYMLEVKQGNTSIKEKIIKLK